VGLRVELELAAIETALASLPDIPVAACLSLNASPATAEGVETWEELATLREIGIGKAQGYLLGRPGPCRAEARSLMPSRKRACQWRALLSFNVHRY